MKIVDYLFNKKKYLKDKAIQEYLDENNMNLGGYGSFSIKGMLVSEFGYLVRYLTNGKVDNFDDFNKIVDYYPIINQGINEQLSMEIPRETEVYKIPKDTADYNMKNLKIIIDTIVGYQQLYKSFSI